MSITGRLRRIAKNSNRENSEIQVAETGVGLKLMCRPIKMYSGFTSIHYVGFPESKQTMKLVTSYRWRQQLIVVVMVSLITVPVLARQDAESRLETRASELTGEIRRLQTSGNLPYLAGEAVARSQAFLAAAEEARKRRNYGASASSLDNADLEVAIAKQLARIVELETEKQGLEAVVEELEQKVGEGRSDKGGSDEQA